MSGGDALQSEVDHELIARFGIAFHRAANGRATLNRAELAERPGLIDEDPEAEVRVRVSRRWADGVLYRCRAVH